MNTRTAAVLILSLIALLGLLGLYGMANKIDPIIEWVDRITILLPGVILLLGFIAWAVKTEKHRAWKIIGGIAVSATASVILWNKYIKELGEALSSAKEKIENWLYIAIVLAIITLAVMAYRKKS
jgi:hypothetical protein